MKKGLKSALLPICALALAGISFAAGFAICYFRGGVSDAKALWIKRMIETHYLEDISPDDVYRLIGSELLDPYSDYYDPEANDELNAGRQGNRSGFGFGYFILPDETYARVGSVVWNSPAFHAGLREGMTLYGVGKSADTIETVPAAEFSAALDALEIQTGETAYFKTDSGVISAVRSAYVQSYVQYRTQEGGYDFVGDALSFVPSGEPLALPETVGYLRIAGFGGKVAEQVETALDRFREEGKRHLILDLRDNGGGTMSTLREVSAFFLKEAQGNRPLILSARYKGGRREEYRASGNRYFDYFSADSEIFVLANENTASASECLLGAMLDYGTIDFGHILLSSYDGVARTYGKGIMQTTYSYLDGSAIKLTTASVHWPLSETNIHGRGILPEDGAIPIPASRYPTTEQVQADLAAMLAAVSDRLCVKAAKCV